jgi:hypothetical protein
MMSTVVGTHNLWHDEIVFTFTLRRQGHGNGAACWDGGGTARVAVAAINIMGGVAGWPSKPRALSVRRFSTQNILILILVSTRFLEIFGEMCIKLKTQRKCHMLT